MRTQVHVCKKCLLFFKAAIKDGICDLCKDDDAERQRWLDDGGKMTFDFSKGERGAIRKIDDQDLVYRLRKRAEIRRQIKTRKSVQEGKPDRLGNLLDEAAAEIEHLKWQIEGLRDEQTHNDERS